ncbi:MAG: hypothetical protein O9297_15415 [Flavobacterium sp.]|jgi:hypothetical protein|uniref:hypothetical protein n=1 Tax=Flavobacterium sp. TaxID=239 RepID=UPI0022C5E825|nr:hypothetical protein [Flavobacterium sp.]MCZ8298598.1 hypothetical protein [Flavobacterium sp.]
MKNKFSAIFLVTFFYLNMVGCKSLSRQPLSNENLKSTSIISVIANPKTFHKKVIKVKGYFTMETEGQAIYFSKNDYEKAIFKNALYLYISYDNLQQMGIEKPYKGYVEIEGTFNKNYLGSYNFYSGGIENIIQINRLYKKGSKTDEFDMD